MKKSIRLYVRGMVQGIFYRAFVKQNAEKLNIKGFVRNLEDGRVEIFLEGDADDVNKMAELCKQGPKNAKVENVEIKEEKFQDFKEFKVLHI